MKVLVLLIALTGSALSQSYEYDSRYVEDNSGTYFADDSGRYIHDRSGEYVHDNSGDYVHQPGPNGPDYSGEATNIGLTILSPNIIPSESRQYLPPTTGFRPPSTQAPPLEPPLVVTRTIPTPPPVPRRPPPVVPVRPAPPVPRRPSPPVARRPPTPVARRPPTPVARRPPTPVARRPPPPVPRQPPPFVPKQPPAVVTIPIRPRPTNNLVLPTPPPAEIASTGKRPGIQGGGPYIWHYESQPHTVDVIDPYHKYRVHFPH